MNLKTILFLCLSINLFGQSHIGVHYELLNGYRTLIYDVEDENLKQVEQERNDVESSAWGYAYGVSYHQSLGNDFNVGVGMSFTKQGFHLYDKKDIRWPSEYIDGKYVKNLELPHRITSSYHLSFVEIPLSISYMYGNRLKLIPQITLKNQFYYKLHTRYNNDVTIQYDSYKDPDIHSYNLSLSGSVSVGYRWKDFIPTLGVVFNRQLLDGRESFINERLYAYGLRSTLKYIF